MVGENIAAIESAMAGYVNNAREIVKKLDANEQTYIKQPWYYGFKPSMHAGGPEFGMLGCAKY